MTLFPRTMSRQTFMAIGLLVAMIGVIAALLAPQTDVPFLHTALYGIASAAFVIAIGYAGVLLMANSRERRP